MMSAEPSAISHETNNDWIDDQVSRICFGWSLFQYRGDCERIASEYGIL
ncbi:MAG: hypothetical protein KatS3mg056_0718 [Chloroflexus sp.]|jgi:hypothetical protein|nr:MAG: hypothetical protein KatS3mg056_0718 [Chloroflexus sp.]